MDLETVSFAHLELIKRKTAIVHAIHVSQDLSPTKSLLNVSFASPDLFSQASMHLHAPNVKQESIRVNRDLLFVSNAPLESMHRVHHLALASIVELDHTSMLLENRSVIPVASSPLQPWKLRMTCLIVPASKVITEMPTQAEIVHRVLSVER